MDRGEICSRFLDVVPYELYPFQEEALLAWFEVEGGLLVTVPTGMGKTLIGVLTFTVLRVGLIQIDWIHDLARQLLTGAVLMVALVINGLLAKGK